MLQNDPMPESTILVTTTAQSLDSATFEQSFLLGNPIWLYKPTQPKPQCQNCKKQLAFLGQIYCPFDTLPHTYHRVLYFFFCIHCKIVLRVFRQQCPNSQDLSLELIANKLNPFEAKDVQIIDQNRLQIEYDDISNNDLQKLIEKSQKAVQQQQQMDNITDSEDESDQETQPTDTIFEAYLQIIPSLSNPVLLYGRIPIRYNQTPINHMNKICSHCSSPVGLEVQLTEKFLGLNQKLVEANWGICWIYTCMASCDKSEQQIIIMQFQQDSKSIPTKSQQQQSKTKQIQQKMGSIAISKTKAKKNQLKKGKKQQVKKQAANINKNIDQIIPQTVECNEDDWN